MKADLHMHTIYSDGEFSPLELVNICKEQKIDIIAITDHDTFGGTNTLLGHDLGIKIIYGLELSTYRNGEAIHILGYFTKPGIESKLHDFLENQRKKRKERAYQIYDLLEKNFNIKLDRSFLETKYSITRGSIADEILKAGYPYSKSDIFKYIMGNDCPCYIPSTRMSVEEGINLIKENGGMPVLAHPCIYTKNNPEDLIKMGVRGVEAVYPVGKSQETKFRDLAKKYNLVVTGGTDFHRYNDYNHGIIGSTYIHGTDVKKFLSVLENEY